MLKKLFYSEKTLLCTLENERMREITHSESLFVKKQIRKLGGLNFSRGLSKSYLRFRGIQNNTQLIDFANAIFVVGDKANHYVNRLEENFFNIENQISELEVKNMIKLINKLRKKN